MNPNFYLQEQNGVIALKCRALDAIPGVHHGFSTRHGGVSEGYLATMNFTYNRESSENVEENFRRFSAANGLPYESLVLTQQVHSTHVTTVDDRFKNKGRNRVSWETDGLVTAEGGMGLVCFTADCVPLLLADGRNGVVAAVHAGWRGTVNGIAAEAVHAMTAAGARPEELVAAIGPSIGPCHFEVGAEVQEAFAARFGALLPTVPSYREGHFMVDLWQANRLILRQAGVPDDRIFTAEVCTFCNNSDYYSHRYTNGRRGLMIAAIGRDE